MTDEEHNGEKLDERKTICPTETEDEDFVDEGPNFFEYLQSKEGHKLASRVVTLIEDIKKVTLDRNAELSKLQMEATKDHRKNTMIFQGMIIIAVIGATVALVLSGKFDSTVGVLFGTLIGYIFGKRSDRQP